MSLRGKKYMYIYDDMFGRKKSNAIFKFSLGREAATPNFFSFFPLVNLEANVVK